MKRVLEVEAGTIEVPEELLDQLAFEIGVAPADLDLTRRLVDLGIDSLFELELVMLLEEYFGVDISDEEVEARHRAGKMERLLDLLLLPTVKAALEDYHE